MTQNEMNLEEKDMLTDDELDSVAGGFADDGSNDDGATPPPPKKGKDG